MEYIANVKKVLYIFFTGSVMTVVMEQRIKT